MEEERKIYPLAKLNESLERFVRNSFGTKTYWIIAEIAKAQEKNGHHYIDLADSENGKRIAEMSANMWFTNYTKINQKLNGELPKIFKSGNKVLLNVRIEFHTIYGLKLTILDVDPSITHGEIERKKQDTIKQLKKEGLFVLQHKLTLPAVIKKIALIGSPNTSGYRDFLSELNGNKVFTNFLVKSFPATVQGDKAIKEIVRAIRQANTYNVDAIVVLRGGGSKMDLNVFNEYEIAKAICESKIPLLTGIGHETDEVVADLVANNSQITPTAVAKFLYVRAGIFISNVNEAFNTLLTKAMGKVAMHKDEFTHTSKYLVHYTQVLLRDNNDTLRTSLYNIRLAFSERMETEQSKLALLLSRAGNYAKNYIALKKSAELDTQLDSIALRAKNFIDKSKVELNNLAELLSLLNPEELLRKGYTISTINEKDLAKYDGDLKGAQLKTLTNKYLIESTITAVKETE